MKSKTDWERLKRMSEKEIIANAKSDKDNPPLTAAQLKKFKPANKHILENTKCLTRF